MSFIPFVENIIGESSCGYNAQVQPLFFPGYSGGVAANIWAEFYANFGYAGLPLLVVLLGLLCAGAEWAIRVTRSATLKAALIVSVIHLSFYIQRKELLGAAISAKRPILVALIILLLAYVYRRLEPRLVPSKKSWRSN
jgi:hypothetical protein